MLMRFIRIVNTNGNELRFQTSTPVPPHFADRARAVTGTDVLGERVALYGVVASP
jgi:hypothetical protein